MDNFDADSFLPMPTWVGILLIVLMAVTPTSCVLMMLGVL